MQSSREATELICTDLNGRQQQSNQQTRQADNQHQFD
jgi:hypothetical protein